jgi:uncharacterized protein
MNKPTASPAPILKCVASIQEIDAQAWNLLAGDNPFTRHEFLSALEQSCCTTRESGW